jgi:hypothetical protein
VGLVRVDQRVLLCDSFLANALQQIFVPAKALHPLATLLSFTPESSILIDQMLLYGTQFCEEKSLNLAQRDK